MEELLKNISPKDLEKLKMLFSIIPGNEPKEIVTLQVFVDEYNNLIKQNRSKAYYVSVMSSFKHLIDFFSAQKSIREIGLKETENFCSYLQQKVQRPASSSRGEGFRVYWRTLKAAFNKAVEWGYVKENYFAKIKLPKRQKVAPVYITSDQLLAICNKIKNNVVKDFVAFAFYTGMRLDEIINLRWKNIDLENRIITVGDERFTTKGRNQRYIPICEEALEVLTKQKVQDINKTPSCILPLKKGGEVFRYVFCKKDGSKYCGNYISRKFKDACKAVEIDSAIHFHSLRHSFASNLVQKGVPLYTIKELLGHSSISTTEIYSHLNMESLREAISKFDVRSTEDEENKPHLNPLLSKERTFEGVKIFKINSAEKG